MAYGEKYKYYFYWDHDDANNYYKASFLFDGYASTVTELTPTEAPWVESIKGQLDTSDNPILGSSVQMQIIAQGAEFTTYDEDFLESEYKDGIVKLIQDPDGTPIVKWVGFLMPANADRDYLGNTKIYSLSAVDGLADLKNKQYSSDGAATGSQLNGFTTMLDVIKTALATVADIPELQLDFRIQLGTFSDQMTSAENAYKESEVVQELFSEVKNGEIEYNSCYEVLQKILIPFNCGICQAEGYYQIFCHGEKDSFYFEYAWATLIQQSRTARNRSINATSYEWLSRGSLYKTQPYKSFDVRLYNKNYDPELIINGGFDANITGWTNGDADDSSNGFSGIVWNDRPGVGGVLAAAWSGAATSGNYHYHSSAAMTLEVGAGKENVNLSVKLEYNQSTPAGLTAPNLVMRLWNATDGYVSGSLGSHPLNTIGGYFEITEAFVVTGMTVADNYLDIQIQITDAGTTSATFYFDNNSMRQSSAETPSDWLYTGLRTNGLQSVTKDLITYIAEQQESDNDICAIKDSGGTYTSTWSRYLKTDNISLIEVLQQYILNSNRGYMSYIKSSIYDPNETIHPFNSLHNDDGDFRIIGMTKDYRKASIKLDIIQVVYVILFEIDTSFTSSGSKLTSEYGESQD